MAQSDLVKGVLIFSNSLLLSLLKVEIITAGVSIKFEVGSRLEKNNRLYEQGAVRPLNLGESRGML